MIFDYHVPDARGSKTLSPVYDIDPDHLRQAIEAARRDPKCLLLVLTDSVTKAFGLVGGIVRVFPDTEGRVYTVGVSEGPHPGEPSLLRGVFFNCRSSKDARGVVRENFGEGTAVRILWVVDFVDAIPPRELERDIGDAVQGKNDCRFIRQSKWSTATHFLRSDSTRTAIKTLMLIWRRRDDALSHLPWDIMFEIFQRM